MSARDPQASFLNSPREAYPFVLICLLATAGAAAVLALERSPLLGAAVLVVGWTLLLLMVVALGRASLLMGWNGMLIVVLTGVVCVPSYLYALPSFLPFDIDPCRVLILLYVLAVASALLVDDRIRLRPTAFDAPISALSAVVFVSLIVNLNRFDPTWESAMAIKSVFYFVALVLLYWAITATVRSEAAINTVLKALVILGAAVAVLGIVEYLTGFNVFWHLNELAPILQVQTGRVIEAARNGNDRINGSTAHPIAFAALLTMILPMGLHYWLDAKTRLQRWTFAGLSAGIAFAAFLTVSRTAIVGIGAILILTAVRRPELRKRILAAAFVLVLFVHLLVPGLVSSLAQDFNPVTVYSSELGVTKDGPGRLEDYPRIFRQLEMRPIVGRGLGTYDPGHFSYVDNQYLMFIAEIGLAGTACVIWLFWRSVARPARAASRVSGERAGLLYALSASALVFALGTACFDSFGFPQVTYLFFVIAALSASYLRVVESGPRGAPGEVTP